MQDTPLAPRLAYKEATASYRPADGVIALCFYTFLMVFYTLLGRYFLSTGRLAGIVGNLVPVLLCLALVRLRGEAFASVGFSTINLRKNLLIGLGLGLVAALVNAVPAFLEGGQFVGASRLPFSAFYYFIVIALSEEILFRGYIQTRLYGLLKKDLAAINLCALMFSLLHIPFQMQRLGLRLDAFFIQKYPLLIITFIAHLFLNLLYRRTNSLVVPVLVHGFLDFGGNLFY